MKLVDVLKCKVGDKVLTSHIDPMTLPCYYRLFEVQIEGRGIFLLSNMAMANGMTAINRRGYCYSWVIGDHGEAHYGLLIGGDGKGIITDLLKYSKKVEHLRA